MRGFFKRITIGNEICYGMEFSLEQLQGRCALVCPLHATSAGSDGRFSAGWGNFPKAGTEPKYSISCAVSE
jgi:hypothetical protein